MRTVFLGGSEDALTTGTAEYTMITSNAGNVWNASETIRANVVSVGGTLEDLYVRVTAAPGGTATRTFTIYLNGSPTDLTVTLGAADTTKSDLTHTVAVVAGDLISIEATCTNTPAGADGYWSLAFESTSANNSPLLARPTDDTSTAATEYAVLYGPSNWNATEAAMAGMVSAGGVITNLYVKGEAAPGTASSGKSFTFTLMKNASAQALACTVLDTATTCNDTSSPITVAAGDRISVRRTEANAPTDSTYTIGVTFQPTVDGESLVMHATDDTLPTTGTVYESLTGDIFEDSTQNNRRLYTGEAIALSHLYVKLATAPSSGASRTLTLNDDASSSGVTMTISDAATTGNDTTHTASVAANSMLTFAWTLANSPDASFWATGLKMYITPTSSPSSIKKLSGVAKANIKKLSGAAEANVKKVSGVSNV